MTLKATGLLLLMVALGGGSSARKQEPGNELVRWTVLTPRDGQEAAFETGYKQHLEWHRAHRDSWSWYGWTVVMGDRFGTFIDASFGHTPQELDSAVLPAEDAADNREHVLPWIQHAETFIVRFRDDLSTGVDDPGEAPWLQLFDYVLDPAQYDEFIRGLRAIRARKPDRHYWLYEFVSGGEHPHLLLILASRSLSQMELSGPSPLPRTLMRNLDAKTARGLTAAVRSTHSEILRYRPELSYRPDEGKTSARPDPNARRPNGSASSAEEGASVH